MRPAIANYRQSGIALLMSLIFLVILTLLALSAVSFSSLEIKMSSNDEMMIEAFQKAISVTDATIADPNNTPVTSQAGFTSCTANITSGCNSNAIQLPGNFEAAAVAAGKITVKTTQVSAEKPPPRKLGSSIVGLGAAEFRVEGRYDRSSEGLGKDEINEGVLLVYPKGGN